MPTLHLLGTGAALSSGDRTTTMLAVEGDRSVIVIDCGGDVFQRLLAAGIDPGAIRALILTHEHPDHVGGFPLFMEKLWLTRKHSRIPVHGPHGALERARGIFEVFDTSGWKGLPEIDWIEVPLRENAELWRDAEWRVTASPGDHGVPVIGLAIEDVIGGGTIAYSADTAPADSIERLATGVDILVHEATGVFPGHTTASQAAELARRAEAHRLVLVHLPPELSEEDLTRARTVFPGVEVGADGGRYRF